MFRGDPPQSQIAGQPERLANRGGIAGAKMASPDSLNVIRCRSNKASRCAQRRKPLKTLSRSASELHSAQGFAWLARNRAGMAMPVTAQVPPQ